MDNTKIYSYAKINLLLDVLHKRKDGYHEIVSIMQNIDLKDVLYFRKLDDSKDEIIIESNNEAMPKDKTNLVCKAYEKLREYKKEQRGIHVYIEKNIPIAAGLAGGSSNCAASLLALNEIWGLNFSLERLMEIGGEIGADVPFCLLGHTALAKGVGEKLQALSPLKGRHILICNPSIEISAKFAYENMVYTEERLKVEAMVRAIEEDNIFDIAKNLGNNMEAGIFKIYEEIKDIKEFMISNGALNALMSGSGSTVFGIYDDQEKLEKDYISLSKKYDKVYKCRTI